MATEAAAPNTKASPTPTTMGVSPVSWDSPRSRSGHTGKKAVAAPWAMGTEPGEGNTRASAMSRYQLASHEPRACKKREAVGGLGHGPVKWWVASPWLTTRTDPRPMATTRRDTVNIPRVRPSVPTVWPWRRSQGASARRRSIRVGAGGAPWGARAAGAGRGRHSRAVVGGRTGHSVTLTAPPGGNVA